MAPYACPEVKRHEITPEEFLKAHQLDGQTVTTWFSRRHGTAMAQEFAEKKRPVIIEARMAMVVGAIF